MKIAAYVLSVEGKPLMPMHSYGKVRKYLKEGKAEIVSRIPFTIKLTYGIENPVTQPLHLGIDTGRTNIGITVINKNRDIVYSTHIETSNKDVPKHMNERKTHRMASRRGERLRRQRRAVKNNTAFETRERILPGCKEPITLKFIKNTEAKFMNRKRPTGWLTPTARHLLSTHLKAISLVYKILPVSDVTIEITQWDFARMNNPGIRNWQYQKGMLFGYSSVEDFISSNQEGKCLMCKNDIDHYHHIVPRHENGSDTADNLCGLCSGCHDKVHTDSSFKEKIISKHQGMLKKYHALSVMNQIMPYLLKELSSKYDVYVTSGYETAQTRSKYGLSKSHCIDAWCIASLRTADVSVCSNSVENMNSYEIKQFRRQNRAIIHAQRERTYYLGKQAVAKNRNKRFEQKGDSLSEWFEKAKALYGEKEAEVLRSSLTVKKSTRYYNNLKRTMPGAIFISEGKRYVLSGQHCNGTQLRAVGYGTQDFSSKKCRVVSLNHGLVYVN